MVAAVVRWECSIGEIEGLALACGSVFLVQEAVLINSAACYLACLHALVGGWRSEAIASLLGIDLHDS
jgi:hypothetical protein